MNNTGFFSVLNMIIYVAAIITFIVYSTIWNYKICTIRSRPGWWALISLASFPSMLLLGLAATGIAVAFPGAMFMFLVMLIVTCGVFIWPFVMYGILAWSYK
jgi:hypothetical protein